MGFQAGTETDMSYGTNMHRAIELYENGILDEKTLDIGLQTGLYAWKNFRRDFRQIQGIVPKTEIRLYSMQFGFCGTLDLVYIVSMKKGGIVIIDIKNSLSYQRYWETQLAGYRQLLAEFLQPDLGGSVDCLRDSIGGYIVTLSHLEPVYKLHQISKTQNSADWYVFKSALNIHNWKTKRGAQNGISESD
jgi:hypothetical protein